LSLTTDGAQILIPAGYCLLVLRTICGLCRYLTIFCNMGHLRAREPVIDDDLWS
jgi:hypothetical protein